jgi:hypothetical protein
MWDIFIPHPVMLFSVANKILQYYYNKTGWLLLKTCNIVEFETNWTGESAQCAHLGKRKSPRSHRECARLSEGECLLRNFE